MTDTIWKFDAPVQDQFDIIMAPEAEVLCVGVQFGLPQMWVRTPRDAILPHYHTQPRRFYVHGTGHEVNENAGRYVGTIFLNGGSLVFHYFEEKRHDQSGWQRGGGAQQVAAAQRGGPGQVRRYH